MKFFLLFVELLALLVACVAFAMGFNETHNALTYVQINNGVDEATRLLEQAHAMFTAAAVCGAVFLALFLIRLLRSAK